MAVVRPFRGCRYNPAVVGDLGSVLCPPYDMIDSELKESLQRLSPYNAVHLEGGEQPDPVNPAAGYQQAAALFRQWLAAGVLRRESEPQFYLMRHGYHFRGQSRSHLALFADIQVDDYEQKSVLPHENTREPAVRDRVALLEASRTQFSPIMTLYRDAEGALQPLFQQVMAQQEPVLAVTDSPEGEVTRWGIDAPQLQGRVTQFFASRPVFLGDGHHRYEAARRYRHEQARREGGNRTDAAYNFTMMALVEFNEPGLLLLPYHKMVRGLSPEQLGRLQERLNELFEAVPASTSASGSANHAIDSVDPIDALADRVTTLGQTQHVVGVVGPGKESPRLLKLRDGIDWRQWGQLAVSEAWILDEQVIKPLLGAQISQYVDYSHDHQEAAAAVAQGQQQLAFLLKPFPMDSFESLVSAGERLPAKSTFFYPKLPTGLILNQLEGTL